MFSTRCAPSEVFWCPPRPRGSITLLLASRECRWV
jgi:hypothetical protein